MSDERQGGPAVGRRAFVGGAAALAVATTTAGCADDGRTLHVLSHKVHEAVLGTGANDLMAGWRTTNGARLAFTTLDSNPLQDRLMREASLRSTDFGVGYIIDNRPTRQVAALFEPLDSWMKADPIEDVGDIAPNLLSGMNIGGRLIGVPVRHATQALFYNEALLEQAGIAGPPETLEDLVDAARRATFRSASGTPVVGMVLASDLAAFPVMFARAFGGDFIDRDLRVMPNPDAVARALTTLRDLFVAGALPRSFALTRNDDQVTWMQQGRAAFAVLPFARTRQLNHPAQSRFPGRIKAMEFPVSASLAGTPMAAVVESWGMAIPRNAADKQLAWRYIRDVASRRVTLGMALNGNGPVRASTYADAAFQDINPLAVVEARALANARPAFPPFPDAARAQGIFLEEVQLAVLGRKSISQAVAAVTARVRPLLPA